MSKKSLAPLNKEAATKQRARVMELKKSHGRSAVTGKYFSKKPGESK